MRDLHKGMLLGAGAVVVLAVLIAGALAGLGVYDIAADTPHAGGTRELIGYVRGRSSAALARQVRVPDLGNPKMLAEGAEHYDAMCTGCHLAPGLPENEMRPGMNP